MKVFFGIDYFCVINSKFSNKKLKFMRKNISSLLLVVALFAFSPMVSNAQEKESAKTETEKKGKKKSKVGSFLKKVGEQEIGRAHV